MQFVPIVASKILAANKRSLSFHDNFLTNYNHRYILAFKMNFSKKDVIIGFIIIAAVIFGAYYYKNFKNPKLDTSNTPVEISFKEELENSFKYDIPEDSNSIELKDVTGGNARGIATENEILVDADDPIVGYYYEGWLQKGDSLVSLGRLQMGKGGWLLEYSKVQYGDFKDIIISLEKTNDSKIEKRILEGSFN